MTQGWTGKEFMPIPVDRLVSQFGMLPGFNANGGFELGADYYLARGIRPLVSNVGAVTAFFNDVHTECEATPTECNAPPQQFCNGFKCPAGSVAMMDGAQAVCINGNGIVAPI